MSVVPADKFAFKQTGKHARRGDCKLGKGQRLCVRAPGTPDPLNPPPEIHEVIIPGQDALVVRADPGKKRDKGLESAYQECYAELSTYKTPSDCLQQANEKATEKVKKQKKKNVEKANKKKTKHHKLLEERFRDGINEYKDLRL